MPVGVFRIPGNIQIGRSIPESENSRSNLPASNYKDDFSKLHINFPTKQKIFAVEDC